MSAWAWFLRSRLPTHLIWITTLGIVSVGWMEFSLYVWTLRGATGLTDGQVPIAFAGIASSMPLANVLYAVWGSSTAATDIRCGMDAELKARRISLLNRTVPQIVAVALGTTILAGLLCLLSLDASPFIVETVSQSSAVSVVGWIYHWFAVVAGCLFMWGGGYYCTMIVRSPVFGAGIACLVTALYAVLPIRVSSHLPGTSLLVWAWQLPFVSPNDSAQISNILKSHLVLYGRFPALGVILSLVSIVGLHVWSARQ